MNHDILIIEVPSDDSALVDHVEGIGVPPVVFEIHVDGRPIDAVEASEDNLWYAYALAEDFIEEQEYWEEMQRFEHEHHFCEFIDCTEQPGCVGWRKSLEAAHREEDEAYARGDWVWALEHGRL